MPCGQNEAPLALLSDLQGGLIDMISLITYAYDDVPPDHLKNAIHKVHILLKEMLVGQDQGGVINEGLPKEKIDEFNKWGTYRPLTKSQIAEFSTNGSDTR